MPERPASRPELAEITRLGRPLDTPADLDPLVDLAGDARFVLLGEASHGTAEYYRWRAEITKRLVTEHGFSFIAVEGDWPDCFRMNRWLKGYADQDGDARTVLGQYERWPAWMWANEEVASFADWLREYNLTSGSSVGFYGLDVYSLGQSMRVVVDYLAAHHPDAVESALAASRCFEPYTADPQEYGWAARMVPASCEDEVVQVLLDVRRRAGAAGEDPETTLDAVQNAEVLAGAERYYRTMMRADEQSWNVRDVHMADTLDRLVAHHGPTAKAVVWEHNTHVGDARATNMTAAGLVNVGQLVRERHSDEGVCIVGFAGHHGSVVASGGWGQPMRVVPVPDAPPDTHEDLLHRAIGSPSLLVFPTAARHGPWLSRRRGHRAIGVVYHPDAERPGNWVPTSMGGRYDAICSFEETTALHPLHGEQALQG